MEGGIPLPPSIPSDPCPLSFHMKPLQINAHLVKYMITFTNSYKQAVAELVTVHVQFKLEIDKVR